MYAKTQSWIKACEMRFLQPVLGVARRGHLRNDDIRITLGIYNLIKGKAIQKGLDMDRPS